MDQKIKEILKEENSNKTPEKERSFEEKITDFFNRIEFLALED